MRRWDEEGSLEEDLQENTRELEELERRRRRFNRELCEKLIGPHVHGDSDRLVVVGRDGTVLGVTSCQHEDADTAALRFHALAAVC